MTYRVKKSECFLVPSYRPTCLKQYDDADIDEVHPVTSPTPEVESPTQHNSPPQQGIDYNQPISSEHIILPETECTAPAEVDTDLPDEIAIEQEPVSPTPPVDTIEGPRRSNRQSKRPKYLEKYECK